MKTIKAFIMKHPVLTYYILVFTISWGGILLVVGSSGYPGSSEQIEKLSLPALLALFAGPSLSGLLMIGLVHGRVGFRDLFSRLLRWRVEARWYAIAILFAPLLVSVILLGLLLFSPMYIPGIAVKSDKVFWLVFSLAWGLIGGGLLEETGWSGFVVPELRRRYSVFTTGLIVGILWGIWHILITFWMSGTPSGDLSLAIFVPAMIFNLVSLPAYRVLLVQFYDRTGSLLLVMLMHALFSSSRMILNPPELDLLYGAIFELVLATALWGVIALVNGRQTWFQPAHKTLTG
jgi:membrane protease YdiL (CAAX protease family)